MSIDILILIVLLLLSGFFSASETALISLSPARVRDLVKKGKPGANMVALLKKHPHKLLITILIGNNLVNIGASVFATIVFQQILGSAALGIITGVLTLFVLIFGEVVPKSFAQSHAKSCSRLFAPFLYFFYILFTPAVFILDILVKGLLHLSTNEADEEHITEDELKAFVNIGAEDGAIEEGEKELIQNVLEFTDTKVRDIMVPRVNIQAIEASATISDLADFVVEHHHSRVPIYKKNIDNVVGVITVKDLVHHMHKNELNSPISKLKMHKPMKVPASKKISDLFHEFQNRRTHLAIVLDEHGGTAGLITLEDILEEIVGEIVDEFDPEEKAELRKIGNTEVEATGKAIIEDINDALEILIPCQDHKSISYYIVEKLGRFPRHGETIKGKGYVIRIEEMKNHAIEKVTISKTKPKPKKKPRSSKK
jgi:putative hemolysin